MVSILTPVSPASLPIVIPSAREAVIRPMRKPLDPVVTTGCILCGMTVKDKIITGEPGRGPALLAAGGLLGALAASSCCILPLALFGLGVSGAWIGHLTRLAPYQPYFIAGTAGCLGVGYWLRYCTRKRVCAEDNACGRPLPNRSVT